MNAVNVWEDHACQRTEALIAIARPYFREANNLGIWKRFNRK